MADWFDMIRDMGDHGVREDFKRLPFSYPGSKLNSLTQILEVLPYRDCYGEGFGGSGVVFLNRKPSKLEIFNDAYSGVTCFFRVVRTPELYEKFMQRISATVHSREEFIWCKNSWRNCEDEVERAARWYYMIRFAVNGKQIASFGRSKTPNIRFADYLHNALPLFGPVHQRFRTATIENLSWRTCLHDYDQPGMVWYLDPTYLDAVKTYESELSADEHRLLVTMVPQLKGFVAVSSYDGPKTNAIYDKAGLWDDKITWKKTTSIGTQNNNSNIFDDGEITLDRMERTEVLWIRKNDK